MERTSATTSPEIVAEHAVLVVGGGPTGLMLAGELALAGVDVAIVERRSDQGLSGSRAGGLHARTIEMLDQRGLAERFLARGKIMQVAGFAGTTLDISDFPTRHNYGLALWQLEIERILRAWIGELGVTVYRGHEVANLVQDRSTVQVQFGDGRGMHARYVAACDGGRSRVRKAIGIDFPGTEPTISNLIAELEMEEEPEWGMRRDTLGLHGLSRLDDSKTVRVLLTEAQPGMPGEPTLDDVRAGLVAVYGKDYGVHSPTWISRFTDATRQAAEYRKGRVLLAGDAAHTHPPDGGQGLQLGLQDAMNLGWKLARVVKGMSPDTLLDTYHAERHPIAARVLETCLAASALRRPDRRIGALRDMIAGFLKMDAPRRSLASALSGLDICYHEEEAQPLLGRRMPDLDLHTANGPIRFYRLLHRAQPVLVNFGPPQSIDITAWSAQVQRIDARYDGDWELPLLGNIAAPAAVLVRPDGYVAWAGSGGGTGLVRALSCWFGGSADNPERNVDGS